MTQILITSSSSSFPVMDTEKYATFQTQTSPTEPSSLDTDIYALYEKIYEKIATSCPWYPILEELVRTENQYLSDISSIVQCYMPKFTELEQEIPDLVTPQASKDIFINLVDIRDFHQRFYQELEPLLGGRSLKGIGKLFQEQAENFKIYSEYCSNHPKSVDLLVKLTKHQSINSHLKSVQISLQHQLNLSTYLLKPVQRVLKYKLLLQGMLKHCQEGTDAHAMISTASERMDFITKEINELKAISENKQILEEIQYGLDSTPFSETLKEYGALHLQDTVVDVNAPKSRQERMVLLLDNALLICKVRAKQVEYARSTGKKLIGRKAPYKFKDFIKLNELTFTQDDHLNNDDQAFFVHKKNGRTKTTYCLRARSVMMKNHWVSTLQDVVLSSFHFNPKLLQHVMTILRYSTLSGNLRSHHLSNSMERNLKLVPISQGLDTDGEVTSQNLSYLSLRPRLATPSDAKKPLSCNHDKDSGISDLYSGVNENVWSFPIQNDYDSIFQVNSKDRDSGMEEMPASSHFDDMSDKCKHEGIIFNWINSPNSASEQNEHSTQLKSISSIPCKQCMSSEITKTPRIIVSSSHNKSRRNSDPSSFLTSPAKKEKPPLLPKPSLSPDTTIWHKRSLTPDPTVFPKHSLLSERSKSPKPMLPPKPMLSPKPSLPPKPSLH